MVEAPNSGDMQLDADCPWPGLAPFVETTQDYFHGRGEEVEQLFRLVRRSSLAVLFGRSGLGKTSLIKAGLFPRLRGEGFFPIYFRIDFQPTAQSPIDQFWKILAEGLLVHGVEGSPHKPRETMWEYFHGRDNDFWGARNSLVTPVLVFDQFEELFTHGRNTQGGSQFLAELADLVENRPPKVLTEIIESNPSKLNEFDFNKDATKILLAFREDFLPEFEGCRSIMPSIMRERMRLTTMTGLQARDVILKSGGALIDEPVADRIIAFIAGAHSATLALDAIEIEPALISVVCRELNERRRRAKRDRITEDLLESARGEIIASFYDSSVSKVNEATREFIQNELLTEGGFRNSCAIADATNTPGVTMEAIEHLIDCRLLRREIYLGTMRLELTHDLLAPVIKERRDQRRAARNQLRHKRKIRVTVGAIALILCGATSATAYYAHRQKNALEIALREKDEKDRLYAEKDKLYADLDRSLRDKEAAQSGAVTNYNVALDAAAKNADIIRQSIAKKNLSRKVAIDLLVNWRSMLDGLKLDSPSQDALQAESRLTRSLYEVYAQLNDTDGMQRAQVARDALADRIINGFPESPEGRQTHAQSLTTKSRMQLAKGDFADAEANARNALNENTLAVAGLPSVVNPNRILARDHFLLGRVLAKRHKLKEAEAEFRMALTLFEPDAGIILIQREIASVRRELSRVLARQGRLDEGISEAERGVLTLKAVPDDKGAYNRAKLIQGSIVLANLKYLQGEAQISEQSIADIDVALDQWRRQDQEYAEWHDLYLWVQRSKGELLFFGGRHDEALDAINKGVADYKLASSAGGDYAVPVYDYMLIQRLIAKIYLSKNMAPSSRRVLEDSRVYLEKMLLRHNSFVDGRALIAAIDFSLGEVAVASGKRSEALSRYAAGIEVMSALVQEYPDDVQWQWDLAMAQISESIIQAQTGLSAARSQYQDAFETLKRILEAHPSVILWRQDFDRLPAFPEIGRQRTIKAGGPTAGNPP